MVSWWFCVKNAPFGWWVCGARCSNNNNQQQPTAAETRVTCLFFPPRLLVRVYLPCHRLAPQRDQPGFDQFLQHVAPRSEAGWELEMSESQDAEWLGLHSFDNRSAALLLQLPLCHGVEKQ